jgi:hypothetical protein
MSMKRVLNQLHEEGKEFVTSETIKQHSKRLYYSANNVIRYLLNQDYIIKIFEGIYYIKTPEELESKKLQYSLLELVGKGLELKGIKNWYYGLYTALRLNRVKINQEKEIFYIMSNRLFKGKPIIIANREFKFIKLKYSLFNFGIEDKKVKFSDFEKTVLDFIYLWKYNGIHSQKIIVDIAKYMPHVEEEKILSYVQYYPETNQKILKEALSNR